MFNMNELILSVLLALIVGFVFGALLICKAGFVIPYDQTKGMYIQLDDGTLWKKQEVR